MPIALPKKDVQELIARTIEAVDNKIDNQKSVYDLKNSLFKTLLHDLMTGQRRVNDLSFDGMVKEYKIVQQPLSMAAENVKMSWLNPILTSDNKKGLKGLPFEKFAAEFDKTCEEHLKTGIAKTFAFIIYDFNSAIHEILEPDAAFIEIDRLLGKDITTFYLFGNQNQKRNSQKKLYEAFNSLILELTNQTLSSIPFIVFF